MELREAISPPPSKIRKLELQAARSSESEPIQEKNVAYLRDTELWDLLPIKSNKRLKADEPLLEGSAAPFLLELSRELEKPLDPQRKEEILLKEIRLFLESEGRDDLAREIKSTGHFEKLPLDLQVGFKVKGWHFNTSNDVGGLDDYQLLCLEDRDKVHDPITDFCNKIGNTLDSDSLFVGFCKMIFMELMWDDTEYVAFERAMGIKSWYDLGCYMKSLLIPWVLNVWTTYRTEARKYDERIELHCQLWNLVVDENDEFSEALYEPIKRNLDPCIEHDFNNVIKYVQQRSFEKGLKKPIFIIDEYFEKSRPVRHLDKGYPLYLKKKVTMAVQLGIIKKEDEEFYGEFAKATSVLKEIDDARLHIWDKAL